AVEAHLRGCADCTAVLNDLRRVIARAQGSAAARPPQTDLWPGVAGRIERIRQPRRVSLTVTQLAAAAVLLIAVSPGPAWRLPPPDSGVPSARPDTTAADPRAAARRGAPAADRADLPLSTGDVAVVGVSLADDQYDAAVADLERALKQGRGKLDAATIAIVEQNLQTIDQAIAQAREALASDPANSYLSGHLVEARRRKLDLLGGGTALTDMD